MVDAAAAAATVRATSPADLPGLKALIDAVGLFPSEMLDGIMAGYLRRDFSEGFWLTYDAGGPMGVAYCGPERMTQGTWNLYLIAVHPDLQGRGHGTTLLRHVEDALAMRGERLLLVETSGLPEFEPARAFYRKCGYDEEARIRDYYQDGEDKVVFRRALAAP
jgi:ribosomal protein S18 acetylase RimI-like enzyme